MFESLMEAYKNMDKNAKVNALIKELEKIIGVLQNVCKEKEIIFIQMIDMESKEERTVNYLDTMFIYIKYLEELIGSYIEKTIE